MLANLLTVKAKLEQIAAKDKQRAEKDPYLSTYVARVLREEGSDYLARKARALNELSGRLSLGLDQMPFVSALLEAFARDIVELSAADSEKLENLLFEATEESKASKDKLFISQRSFLQELSAVKQRVRLSTTIESEISSKFFEPLSSLDSATRALVECIVAERAREISDHFQLHYVPLETHLTLKKTVSDFQRNQKIRDESLANFKVDAESFFILADVTVAEELKEKFSDVELDLEKANAEIKQLKAIHLLMQDKISDHKIQIETLNSMVPPPPPKKCERQVSTDSKVLVFFAAGNVKIDSKLVEVRNGVDAPPSQEKAAHKLSICVGDPTPKNFWAPLDEQPLPVDNWQEISDRPPMPNAPRRQRVADCPPEAAEERTIPAAYIEPVVGVKVDWKLPGKAKKLDFTKVPIKPAELCRWKKADVIGNLDKAQIEIIEIFPVDTY